MPPPRRRRMLALPAVCPCEAIAPAPLLASLLSLAADVAGLRAADLDALPALRGAAREAVRIAGLLLAFLDGIPVPDADDAAAAPALVLALSELHVALQKLRLLLADCARKGARLWILMNAELAASELRALLGSVATAIDVLLPGHASSSADAEEIAGLVSRHAWRAAARLRPDPDDGRAARGVRSVLARFASGVTPDAEDARLVLARVGLATWSDYSDEAAFLEAELLDRLETCSGGSDGDGDGDSDLVLIGGLMAFLLYCRVVLFDRIDDSAATTAAASSSSSRVPPARSAAAVNVNPEALQCPITLELMTDPVTVVATGQTYDRASIKKWIKSGCRTCPVTGERLRTADLVPNLAARGVIEQLLLSRGVPVRDTTSSSSKHRCAVDKTSTPFGPAAAGGVRLATAFLTARLSSSEQQQQRKATHEARKLSKRNVFYRACLVEAGAVPRLLHLLSSPDACVQDNAVAALLNLSKHAAGRRALVDGGGLGPVVDAVSAAAKAEARQNAAAVLFYLSSNRDYCGEISRIPEAVPTLVRLLARDGAYRGRKNALVSLYGLLQCADAHGRAVSAGAVDALAGLMLVNDDGDGGGGGDLALDAVALLARIAEQPGGARAVAASSQLVTRLADVLGEAASRSAKEHCVALLASLGRHCGDTVLPLLGKLPGLMPALYALIAEGTPQAGKRARWLVNEIHRHYDYEQRQTTTTTPAPAPATGDRVIRV